MPSDSRREERPRGAIAGGEMYRGMAAVVVLTALFFAPGARGAAHAPESTTPSIEPAALTFVLGQEFVSRAPLVERTTVDVPEPDRNSPATDEPKPEVVQRAPRPTIDPASPTAPAPVSAPVQSIAAPPPAAPPAQVVVQPHCVAAPMSAQAAALLQALNAERTGRGLAALGVDACAAQVAALRANDLATRGYFSHTSPDGSTAASLLAGLGLGRVPSAENLAMNNYPDGETVAVAVRDLMASAPHRGAILNGAYGQVGVASADGGDGMRYYVMVFLGQ